MTRQEDLNKMKKQTTDFNTYWPCLLNNQATIENAVIDSDYTAIQNVFQTCNVPKSNYKKLMDQILHCDMQPWG